MKSLLTLVLLTSSLLATAADYVPQPYVWHTPSANSSASMPCGGGDIGMNVWVENGDLLIYMSRSGWFDENNTLLKAGRLRLPVGEFISQTLNLDDGSVVVRAGDATYRIWADVHEPVIFIDVATGKAAPCTVSYESWRYRDRPVSKDECQQNSWKWRQPADLVTRADTIRATDGRITFWHQNPSQTVFDATVAAEGLDSIKAALYNPIGSLRFGGTLTAPGFRFTGTTTGRYASTDYKAYTLQHQPARHSVITVTLDTAPHQLTAKASRKRSGAWWHALWQRSYIIARAPQQAVAAVRNAELFRYMLACNAYGLWPTKFNGGLFTFDPEYVDPKRPFTPDYRCWGGGTMTAQNQRLVYWPMLRSGDSDMIRSQIDTYIRMLPNAEARTRAYWHHDGASFTEQIENFGLPNIAEYGKHKAGDDPGTERNAWLEYVWDTALEFCLIAIHAGHPDAERLTRSCLTFFDQHYQYLAKQRGVKPLTSDGRLVIYPGSGCETYKMAYNPSSTIAALRAACAAIGDTAMVKRIPDIPLCTLPDGTTAIAPATAWARRQNVETPQLYPVFPWRVYGVGRPALDIARNTYLNDPWARQMRSIDGWKQDNIWAADLGLADEAAKLNCRKLADGPYRFPAFWPQGFDWAPDHNRGGAALIGLYDMMLQEAPDGTTILFPAIPKDWDITFRLHTYNGKTVEASSK